MYESEKKTASRTLSGFLQKKNLVFSHGFTHFHLVSLGFTCFHMVSHVFTWFHIFSLGFTHFHLVSHVFTWFHMFSLDFTCFHMVSHIFTWFHTFSPWFHTFSLIFTYFHGVKKCGKVCAGSPQQKQKTKKNTQFFEIGSGFRIMKSRHSASCCAY